MFSAKLPPYNVQVYPLTDIHPLGNKYFKLKNNLEAALDRNAGTFLTYGGAYSNHIAATALACRSLELDCIGVIRGEELGKDLNKTLSGNPTLRSASDNGMRLYFVDRKSYRLKNTWKFARQLHDKFGDFHAVPEGGTNELAVRGCEEILCNAHFLYDHILVAGGTGGTAAGIIRASQPHQTVWVFSALKGGFLRQDIARYTDKKNFVIISDDYFGGYAKSDDSLIDFMNEQFKSSGHRLKLDPVYTSKVFFRASKTLLDHGINANSRILAIHTGGLQGIAGYNQMLRRKNRKTLLYDATA